MRLREMDKQVFWYCEYVGRTPILDSDGNETGEYALLYTDPVEFEGNVSSASGVAQYYTFGNFTNYDRVVIVDDVKCPITENSCLFIDREPSVDEYGSAMFDYRVTSVSKSRNFISYAVKKVTE